MIVRRRKRETNMTLNQLPVLPKPVCLTKLFNNYFTCTALEGVIKRTFWTWNWHGVA
jgi:hypothetical protein